MRCVPAVVCTRRSAGRTPWALADALMPIFGKTTSKPELAKKGSIDARMKAQVSAREAEAARKAREATADAMQEAAAAVVMQRATRTRSAAETKAKKDLEDQQAAPHSVCTPPALHALHLLQLSTPPALLRRPARALGSCSCCALTLALTLAMALALTLTLTLALTSWLSCATSATWTSRGCAAAMASPSCGGRRTSSLQRHRTIARYWSFT